jgi:hypothetical protein
MNPTSSNSPGQNPRQKFGLRLFWLGLSLPLCAGAVNGVFRHFHPPAWLVIPLALLPLAPLIAGLKVQKLALAQSDELARHIARDAFAFAFYALIGTFICVDLLRLGGVLPTFSWDTKWLLTVMGGMFGLGYGWSAWRYR